MKLLILAALINSPCAPILDRNGDAWIEWAKCENEIQFQKLKEHEK